MPIPKKGNLTISQNWHPIVINIEISKLLELVMKIMNYVSQSQLS